MSRRRLSACLSAVLALALVGGCGGDSVDQKAQPPPSPARPADFPEAHGKTLAQLQKGVGGKGLILAPTQSVYKPGSNRFGFALFDTARKQISDLSAVVYVARVGGGKARRAVPAKWESLAVKPQFQSRSAASDPDAAKSLYVAEVDLPKAGAYEVLAIARLHGRLVPAASVAGPIKVSTSSKVPDIGDKPPAIDTPTKASAGGDIRKIDTRAPPSTQHDKSFKDVLGRKPAILLFATPALCQSRVCGPVVDVAEQGKARRGADAEFIQQEIFVGNDLSKCYRPQVKAFYLPSEPWLFAVDRRGRVAARIEGAFSAAELQRAVDAAVKR
ncbi:MAG: hypothetical protein ACR2J6_02005 [Thermoleophilaceae bacterium]